MFDNSKSTDVSSDSGLKSADTSDINKVVNLNFCNSREATVMIQEVGSVEFIRYHIIVEPGTAITVNIKGNPTTGYSQKMIIKPEESIVKPIGAEPDYVPAPHEAMMVGYGGIYVFRFLAVGFGETISTIEYARYFETPRKCIFKAEIQFEVVDHCNEKILKE